MSPSASHDLGSARTWASVLGDDAHGDYLADAVGQLGVTPLVRSASGPTALMFKAGGADGDPEVLQVRHASAFAHHAEALLTDDVFAFDGIQHLHLTGIALGISPTARAAGADAARRRTSLPELSVSFDPNLRLNLWPDRDEMRGMINTVAARATVVMPGLAEGRLLTGARRARRHRQFYLRRAAREKW